MCTYRYIYRYIYLPNIVVLCNNIYIMHYIQANGCTHVYIMYYYTGYIIETEFEATLRWTTKHATNISESVFRKSIFFLVDGFSWLTKCIRGRGLYIYLHTHTYTDDGYILFRPT